MRGVTLFLGDKSILTFISTHTPHARRDCGDKVIDYTFVDFNSHASCEA